MMDEYLIRQMLENLRNDIKYDLQSLNINNFEPKTRKSLELLLNNVDILLESIKNIPTVPKIINTLFPVNSVYIKFWKSGEKSPPFSFGTWNIIQETAVSDGSLIFWRRTA